MINEVLFLGKSEVSITGGHKYNDELLSTLSYLLDATLKFTPSMSQKYQGFSKIFAPILELKEFNSFDNNKLVFFADTSYKYHFILILLNAIFHKAKSAIIIHHFPFLNSNCIVHKIFQCLYYSMADYIIIPSPYTMSIAQSCLRNKKIHYIPIPFNNTMTVSEKYESGNLLYVGTIEPRKGIIYMLKAINECINNNCNKIHLNIVGKVTDKQYYNTLTEYIAQHNLSQFITFHGRISNNLLDSFYKQADMFIFPSQLEGYGIVLIEAMKYGLPIISFNNSAMPYTIKDGINGFLVKNKDYTEMANKIQLMLNNPALRMTIQNGIRETVNNLPSHKTFKSSIHNFIHSITI